MRKLFKVVGLLLFLTLVGSVFILGQPRVAAQDDPVTRPQGWTEATHGKGTDGNYSVVFPEDKVQRIDIVISAANYKTMENDLAGLSMMSAQDPVYVPATIKFNNITWWDVGIRYKGQSTLYTPKTAGKHKYPFRLTFDKFEATYPEIKDQRFYGFSQLTLSNNWYDPSFIRDKVCGDILRAGGIPTSRTAFCRVYVDTGNGPLYWGLYTMAEDPSDEMLKAQFGNSKGNLYKGQQATGADLRSFNQQSYEKKTNEDANDWSDLRALVTALNSSRSNAANWRAGLEKVFNVELFLRWLAINTTIENFDTYGWVTKNHYFYQDLADNGRLVYIPCDFNMSLGGYNMGIKIPSLSLSEITNSWPLIRFLIDDPVYKSRYHEEMRTAIDGCFNEAAVKAKMQKLHELIRPYVVGTEGESGVYTYLRNGATEFNQALTTLLQHVTTRQTAARNYLGTVPVSPTVTSTPTIRPTPTATATFGPTATVTPAPSASNNYTITYTVQNDWGGGATVNVTMKNNSTTALSSWKLVWNFAGNQQITNLWNGALTQSGTTVTVTNANYNGTIAAGGGTVSFGFNLSYSGTNAKPTGFTLNGVTVYVE
jgi:spore coat protein H